MGCRVASGPDQTLPFRYFKTSPEIIRLAVMLYIRFPPSLRNVEDMMHERGIDICHETVRFWSNRFGTMIAAEIRRRRVDRMRDRKHWRWHHRRLSPPSGNRVACYQNSPTRPCAHVMRRSLDY